MALLRGPGASRGGLRAGFRLSLVGMECTPPTGKKGHIVPISGRATTKGRRGAVENGGERVLHSQGPLKSFSPKVPPDRPNPIHSEYIQGQLSMFILIL